MSTYLIRIWITDYPIKNFYYQKVEYINALMQLKIKNVQQKLI